MQVNEQTLFSGTDSFVTLKHLTIRGTNFQIGQKLAELAIERYGQVTIPLPVNLDHVKARRTYFQHSYPFHWDRMRGVAAAFGLDPEDDIKANHACVNFMKLIEEMRADPTYEGNPADNRVRTLWHSLYDQQAGTAEFSFYLGEEVDAGGT